MFPQLVSVQFSRNENNFTQKCFDADQFHKFQKHITILDTFLRYFLFYLKLS